MVQELLFKDFDNLLETHDSIPKIRELILQLAVQGKLVPQDPKDEPASVLLEKIKKEKEQLVKEGKIKKSKPLPPIDLDEVPYVLPEGWGWVRLDEICYLVTDGTHHTPTYVKVGVPFLSVKDVSKGLLDFSDTRYISRKEHLELIKRCHPEFEDILLTKVGTTGIAKVIGTKKEFSIFVSLALLKFNKDFIYPYYFEYLINSPIVRTQSEVGTEGVGNKNLVLRKIKSFILPIPPTEEQKRIVAKVDKLMALCDELEEKQKKAHDNHLKLNKASLSSLLNAKDSSEFSKHWKLICDNFDLLYSEVENVKELRQAVIQLAVQGKLVPQDPKDEPGSVLLEKIKKEKERLIKEGRIKKSKSLPPIEREEIPYELPEEWRWVRLGEVVDYGGAKKVNPKDIPSDTWVLGLEDIEKDTSHILRKSKFREKYSKSTKAYFERGDVLYGKLRPYLNKVIVADEEGYCTTEILPLRSYYGIHSTYLMYSLKRPDFLAYVDSKTYGIKMPRLGTNDGKNSLFPLAPYNEQKRIVAKIDKLMALCDELENKIKQSEALGEKLLESVVHNALTAESS